jgi:hypothetical protein
MIQGANHGLSTRGTPTKTYNAGVKEYRQT